MFTKLKFLSGITSACDGPLMTMMMEIILECDIAHASWVQRLTFSTRLLADLLLVEHSVVSRIGLWRGGGDSTFWKSSLSFKTEKSAA